METMISEADKIKEFGSNFILLFYHTLISGIILQPWSAWKQRTREDFWQYRQRKIFPSRILQNTHKKMCLRLCKRFPSSIRSPI